MTAATETATMGSEILFPEFSGDELKAPHFPLAPMRVMVAEPDVVSRRLITSSLGSELITVVESSDHHQVRAAIRQTAPDILVADARSLTPYHAEKSDELPSELPPATIVTAYDPATLASFAPFAVELLVKPFAVDRLERALDLARLKAARSRIEGEMALLATKQHAPAQRYLERVTVESDYRMVLIRTRDIDWIQSAGAYVRLHVGNTAHQLRQTMKNLEAMLDPKRFLRVHRNAIVNLDRVAEFYLPPTGNMFVRLTTGLSIPLRRDIRSSLRKLLKDLS